jgi:hypothetical protein
VFDSTVVILDCSVLYVLCVSRQNAESQNADSRNADTRIFAVRTSNSIYAISEIKVNGGCTIHPNWGYR